MDVDDFRRCLDVNLTGAFLCVRRAVPAIKAAGGGSIVLMSSNAGTMGLPFRAPYVASKWGVIGLTKTLAMELGPHGIRVNTIGPTFIETPLTRPFFEDAAFKASVLTKIKLGRIGQVEDLMGAILFLAGDASALMTGSALVVDGGWTAD